MLPVGFAVKPRKRGIDIIHMKRITAAFLLLWLMTLCLSLPALASKVIMSGGCDVFAEPDTESRVIGHANEGQEMPYLGAWSDDAKGMRWFKTEHENGVGWVPARYAELYDEDVDLLSRQPSYYFGAWQDGGGDYCLYINDFKDEEFTLDLDIYRLWSFDHAMAVLEGDNYATFVSTDDPYEVIGKLDFMEDRLMLTILISNYPDLDEGKTIVFERA